MDRSWVSSDSLSMSRIAILSVVLTGCGSSNPLGPSPMASRPDVGADTVTVQSFIGDRAVTAAADTIRIVRGLIEVAFRRPGTAELRGSHGFTFEGRTFSTGVDPNSACQTDSPCTPGETVSFTGTWAGSDLPGTATLEGKTFTGVGGVNSDSGLTVTVTGSFVAPPEAETATVTGPVEISGVFSSPAGLFDLEGRGTATITLEWVEVQGLTPTWVMTESSFQFGGGGT
jgi:hypothetical protein